MISQSDNQQKTFDQRRVNSSNSKQLKLMSNVETIEGGLFQEKDSLFIEHINKKIKFEDMKKDNFKDKID